VYVWANREARHFAAYVRIHEVERIDRKEPQCCNIALIAIELTFAERSSFPTVGGIVLLVAPISIGIARVIPCDNATHRNTGTSKKNCFRY
jgi:hypothetical protein